MGVGHPPIVRPDRHQVAEVDDELPRRDDDVDPLSRSFLHLEAAADDRVARGHYVDSKGTLHALAARAVVVACGAVHTPRLLLASV